MFAAQIADLPDEEAREELLDLVWHRLGDEARLRSHLKQRQSIEKIIAEDERAITAIEAMSETK